IAAEARSNFGLRRDNAPLEVSPYSIVLAPLPQGRYARRVTRLKCLDKRQHHVEPFGHEVNDKYIVQVVLGGNETQIVDIVLNGFDSGRRIAPGAGIIIGQPQGAGDRVGVGKKWGRAPYLR